jgi:hypothetical protein
MADLWQAAPQQPSSAATVKARPRTAVQDLLVVEKAPHGPTTGTSVVPVRFLPLTRDVRPN